MIDAKIEAKMTDNSYVESYPFTKNGKQYICELKIIKLEIFSFKVCIVGIACAHFKTLNAAQKFVEYIFTKLNIENFIAKYKEFKNNTINLTEHQFDELFIKSEVFEMFWGIAKEINDSVLCTIEIDELEMHN